MFCFIALDSIGFIIVPNRSLMLCEREIFHTCVKIFPHQNFLRVTFFSIPDFPTLESQFYYVLLCYNFFSVSCASVTCLSLYIELIDGFSWNVIWASCH